MDKPNIFKFGKKELTQDAIVAWIFECLKCNSCYRSVGVEFIKLIFGKDIDSNEVELDPEGVKTQYYKMDVFAIVRINNTIHPIIVEDKTDSFLHSDQLAKYCEKVAKWIKKDKAYFNEIKKRFNNDNLVWGDIIYVYYKSGYVPNYENYIFKTLKKAAITIVNSYEINLKVKEIYLDDMINFLESLSLDDEMLKDYLNHLLDNKQLFDESYENALSLANQDDYAKYYSNFAGLYRLFENAFGESPNINNHIYQGWASHDIFSLPSKINADENNNIFYTFRFERCASSRKKHAYAFQLQQYRYERGTLGNDKNALLEEKFNQAKAIQDLCVSIIKKMNTNVKVQTQELSNKKSYDGKMILKVFIEDDNSPKAVCSFINCFTSILTNSVNNL